MTYKSQFIANGYKWIWMEGDDALLREKEGNIERWRCIDKDAMPPGEDVVTMQASSRLYVYVRDETLSPLPLTNRFDLECGQIVEILPEKWRKRATHGVIESTYRISGGVRYRVRLDVDLLKAFLPNQIKVYDGA